MKRRTEEKKCMQKFAEKESGIPRNQKTKGYDPARLTERRAGSGGPGARPEGKPERGKKEKQAKESCLEGGGGSSSPPRRALTRRERQFQGNERAIAQGRNDLVSTLRRLDRLQGDRREEPLEKDQNRGPLRQGEAENRQLVYLLSGTMGKLPSYQSGREASNAEKRVTARAPSVNGPPKRERGEPDHHRWEAAKEYRKGGREIRKKKTGAGAQTGRSRIPVKHSSVGNRADQHPSLKNQSLELREGDRTPAAGEGAKTWRGV